MADNLLLPGDGKTLATYDDGTGHHQKTLSRSHGEAVGEGLLPDHTALLKYGANADVGTSEEIVASQGGVLLYPSGAAILHIVSAAAADSSAGTGAQTVQVYGLDASYAEINETVSLDGAGAGFIATSLSYLRVNRMIVRTAGSGEKNAGLITAQNVAESEVYLQIDAGLNQTLAAQWTVPASRTFYMKQLDLSSAALKGSRFRLCARPLGEVFQVKYAASLFASALIIPFPTLYPFAAKTDIQVRAEAITTADEVTAAFHGWHEG